MHACTLVCKLKEYLWLISWREIYLGLSIDKNVVRVFFIDKPQFFLSHVKYDVFYLLCTNFLLINLFTPLIHFRRPQIWIGVPVCTLWFYLCAFPVHKRTRQENAWHQKGTKSSLLCIHLSVCMSSSFPKFFLSFSFLTCLLLVFGLYSLVSWLRHA